jgi:hypothetical protein
MQKRRHRLAVPPTPVRILDKVATTLNRLLAKQQPDIVDSAWIRRRSPASYRLIQRWVRRETGGIDWDRVTNVLDPVHQRRWRPPKRKAVPYENSEEVYLVMTRYRAHLYVFLHSATVHDRHMQDAISISLVRLAQKGNLLARQQLMEFIGYTIDLWIEHYEFLSRWRGYEEDLRRQVEGCILRYRYTGSFIRYLFRTLEYAARGIRPMIAYSLDEPLLQGKGRKIDLVVDW